MCVSLLRSHRHITCRSSYKHAWVSSAIWINRQIYYIYISLFHVGYMICFGGKRFIKLQESISNAFQGLLRLISYITSCFVYSSVIQYRVSVVYFKDVMIMYHGVWQMACFKLSPFSRNQYHEKYCYTSEL